MLKPCMPLFHILGCMAYSGCETQLDRVPATILTGFLGSGKTTLLNHILSATHGKKIAIIENEFGDVSIDDALLAKNSKYSSDEEIVEVLNGCLCCTVRSDLIAILQKLADRTSRGEIALDAIVIETTGMADPAPVAQTFLIDEKIRDFARLDGIVTLVDVIHIEQHLDAVKPHGTVNEAAAQVGFADRLLLNKMDLLVSPADGERVEARLRAINPYAPIQRCTRSEVSVDSVLNIHGFDLERTLTALPDFLNSSAPTTKHDSSVTSVSLSQTAARHMRMVRDGDLDLSALHEWLGDLLARRGADMFRIKGVLSIAHSNSKFVCHAVHTIFTADFDDEEWVPGEPRKSKLVFIGKGLDEAELAASFNGCLATRENYARRAAGLRFAVGEQVEFCCGDDEWVDAKVVSHWFRDDSDMPAGFVAPYEVHLHDEPAEFTTWADADNDHFIRRKGTPADGGSVRAQPPHSHGHHAAKMQKTSS